jgi:hypothetical protein
MVKMLWKKANPRKMLNHKKEELHKSPKRSQPSPTATLQEPAIHREDLMIHLHPHVHIPVESTLQQNLASHIIITVVDQTHCHRGILKVDRHRHLVLVLAIIILMRLVEWIRWEHLEIFIETTDP